MTGQKDRRVDIEKHNCICHVCGISFYLPQCRLLVGRGKYCSKACQHKSPEYRRKNSLANIGKKRSDETKRRNSLAKSGEKHPNWGKHLSKTTKEKIRHSNIGKLRSFETKNRISLSHIGVNSGENHYLYGKHLSDETKKKISESHIGIQAGENHPMWKRPEDRTTPLNDAIRTTNKYMQWRTLVFNRDDYTCQLCGIGGVLEAHHINPLHQIIKDNNIKSIEHANECNEMWDITNGVTLCKTCHRYIPFHTIHKVGVCMHMGSAYLYVTHPSHKKAFESQGIEVLTYPE